MNQIFWIFIAALMLAPVPFGMVYGIFQAGFAVIILSTAFIYCLKLTASRNQFPVSLYKFRWEVLAFLVVVFWGIFQLVQFTPQAWHHPLWMELDHLPTYQVKGSVSLTPGAGIESIVRYVLYGVIFWFSLQWGRNRDKACQIIWAIIFSATACSFYGIVIYFGGYEKVLWVDKTRYLNDLTGTFINRNSFATYAGMALTCACGLYLRVILRAIKSRRIGRDKALHIVQEVFLRGFPLLTCVVILVTALFLTNSRAGVMCSLISLGVLVFFMGFVNKISSRFYQIISCSLLFIIIGVFFLSGQGWMDRMSATEMEREGRIQIYTQTWNAIKQAPWTGYGMGSFEQTFPMFADERTSHWRKAHNDWLEMIYDLGIPVAFLWFLLLSILTIRCLTGFFKRRRDKLYPLLGLCAAVLTGLHSLVDFSFQIPAIAATYAAILGVGVAQSWSSLDE
ncbi:MAG: O-antigen ligase domain-containing protein [Desulfonatronovibrio sp. MSAO_Bac4]|nr:MAG: O-antigen ligase domain-containing protein [Desulfonatronovibrio sp. MSAO_Bac4]